MMTRKKKRLLAAIACLFAFDASPVNAQDESGPTVSTRRVASPPLPSEVSEPFQPTVSQDVPLVGPAQMPPSAAVQMPNVIVPDGPKNYLTPGELPRGYEPSAPFSAKIGADIYREPEPDAFAMFHRNLALRAPSHVEQAVPVGVFRTRADLQYRMNHPDRAEYFWPKNGVYQNVLGHADAKGPIQAESNVNALDVSFYVEAMLSYHVSVWTNVPFRSVDPEMNLNESGVGDISGGLKWAVILDPNRALSLQIAGIFPSGEGLRGLGSENYWVQPGILWQEGLTENLTFYADVHDNIPVNPRSDFTGHVLRYGAGLSYLIDLGNVRVMPLAEVVGWTVLNGKQSFQLGKIEPLIQSARGMTILDAYFGMRFNLGGDTDSQGFLAMSDLYMGYGRSLLGNWWFQDQWRLEYRFRF